MTSVILYYNFSEIDNVSKFCAEHRRKCLELGLLGRVYIAKEGINGTLSGSPKAMGRYKEYVCLLSGFEGTQFKDDEYEENPFVKLIVRIRPELATLKSSIPLDITKEKGQYLEPQEWKEVLDSKGEIALIDVRNNYESKIGYFEGAIRPDLNNFYDFPQWLESCEIPKEKQVLMYCTGGIRCEKFSVLMEKKGWKNVKQLHGGIIRYAGEVGDAHYKGKCFIFDDRLVVPVEKNQKKPLAKCEIIGIPCDRYLNCANPDCNRLFICSEAGAIKYEGCCCERCLESPRRRPFDQNNIYEPTRKWYKYFLGKTKEEYTNSKKIIERVQ